MTKNSSENVEPFLPPLHLASAGGRGVVRVRHLGRYHAVTTRDNLFALDDAGRSALQTAKWCAGRTALCII